VKPAKKLLFLAAGAFQVNAIRAAVDMGYDVTTADYLPDNPGHRFAHRHFIVSTTEREAVLALARQLEVDGVFTYASDVALPTAAYVAGRLRLPTVPHRIAETVTRKRRFYAYLERHGFPAAQSRSFATIEPALRAGSRMKLPFVVKPSSSSGSKGVRLVQRPEDAPRWIAEAFGFTVDGSIVFQELIASDHPTVVLEGFIHRGRLTHHALADGYRVGLAPIANAFPSRLPLALQRRVVRAVQALVTSLGVERGPVDADIVVARDGTPFIVDFALRSGGNLMPEAAREHTGADFVRAAIAAAMGDPYLPHLRRQRRARRPCFSYIIHSRASGVLKSLRIAPGLRDAIACEILYKKPGDEVREFESGKDGLGALLVRGGLATPGRIRGMEERIRDMEKHIRIKLEPGAP